MDATLNLYSKLLAFSDKNVSSNPRLRSVDWEREALGIAVVDPVSQGFEIPIGSSKVIFDGIRTTTLDNTSAFSIGINFINPSLYRITWTGGTNSTFRTGRNLTLTGIAVTFAVNLNNTVSLTIPNISLSDFSAVVAGDTLFIPNTSTGDSSSPVNDLNSGYWQVLSKTDAFTLTISRFVGTDFEGVGETVTLTSNSQLRAFGPDGVQPGDSVAITSGFALATQKTFPVANVTDLFVEIESSLGLPFESNIMPTASGMIFYTDNKRILYVEADQECALKVNGDTSESQRVSPIEPGNPSKPGIYLKTGDMYSLTVVNKSTSTLNLLVISAG